MPSSTRFDHSICCVYVAEFVSQNYESIEGGFVDQGLVDLTGGIASRVDMTKPATQARIRDGSLWLVAVIPCCLSIYSRTGTRFSGFMHLAI